MDAGRYMHNTVHVPRRPFPFLSLPLLATSRLHGLLNIRPNANRTAVRLSVHLSVCPSVCLSSCPSDCLCLQFPSKPKPERPSQTASWRRAQGPHQPLSCFPSEGINRATQAIGCIMTLWRCARVVLQNILMLAIMSVTAQCGSQGAF